MDSRTFLELFVRELESNHDLQGYYHLLDNKRRFLWRKAYLEQRLDYILEQLGSPSGRVWDAGCGYGTTAIFLALNGYEVTGTTIEYYYDKIFARLEYWSRYGSMDNLKVEYANLFDMPEPVSRFDAVIAQDTLHHLEPVQEAMAIFNLTLRQEGKLIVAEENGSSLFINLKNICRRGFKTTTAYYDERLGKTIPLGNENARGLQGWKQVLRGSGLELVDYEYIRFLPPCFFNERNYYRVIRWEKETGKKTMLLREMMFFGINFTAVKNF